MPASSPLGGGSLITSADETLPENTHHFRDAYRIDGTAHLRWIHATFKYTRQGHASAVTAQEVPKVLFVVRRQIIRRSRNVRMPPKAPMEYR